MCTIKVILAQITIIILIIVIIIIINNNNKKNLHKIIVKDKIDKCPYRRPEII